MEIDDNVQITLITRVVGRNGGNQSISVTTPGGEVFTEAAWLDLLSTQAAQKVDEKDIKVGIKFELEITEAVIPQKNRSNEAK